MLTTLVLSSEELARLNYERYHYPCPIIQKRLHAVFMKATTDLTNAKVGQLTDSHYNSVGKWIKMYKRDGFDGLCKLNRHANQSVLESQALSIKEIFISHPPRSIAEARIKIAALTGIDRSNTRVAAFMKRNGFRFLKTGHIPAKLNNSTQQNWVNETLKPVIEAAQQQEVHLLFMDAAHFVLQPFLCCLWCIKRVFIKASAGRNRINVLGAVNAITKEVTTMTNTEYIDAKTIVDFLKQLKHKYPDKPIAIVLDNARYQHCFFVTTWAKSMGIHLLFLPPYSPNLNIIERLWKFTKKEILNARYYDSPKLFHLAINNFFENINSQHALSLNKLLTLKFQFFDNNISHSYAA
jgi:transposase